MHLLSFCLMMLVCVANSSAEDLLSRYIKDVPNAETVIVFVHGFRGDSVSAWKNDNGAYWPQLLADDPAFDGIDIYTYSYASGLQAALSIDELAENMRATLQADEVSKHLHIIFLSHSMGGLVTRDFLLKNREVAAKTDFAYFYSTPTTGSQVASLLRFAASGQQLGKLQSMNSDDFLADQMRQWLSARFGFPSYCAYEKQKTFGLSLVVSMQSAAALCNRPLDPIDADHIGIVKPSGPLSMSYIAFKAAYGESRVRELTGEINSQEKKKKIRLSLGKFIDEGRAIEAQCADETRPPPSQETNFWAQRTEAFLRENLDESYISRYRDSSGMPMTANSISSVPHRNLWAQVYYRVARLHEFWSDFKP